ncbi:hypothetical protein [Amycolatopsis sp. NPDC003861]
MNEPIDVAAFVAQLADDNRLARELDDLVAHDVRVRADDAVLAELEPATEAPLLEQLVARALCVFLEAQLHGLHAVRDAPEYEAALYKTFGEVALPEPARYDEAIEAYRRLIQEDE